jgi:putative N6-adenine-specific DNA methylase
MMIDTSGVALHKRGYRPQTLVSPLRETLAAGLAKMARPREEVLFWDPFCGSATIPIEAAMIMTNTAPGLFRGFAAQGFDAIPQELWKDAKDEARSLINTDTKFEAYASDISPEALKNARSAISKSGMKDHIKLFERNALEITTEGRRGTIVCNPPYGERLGTLEEAEKLYRDMGKHFKTLDNWQIYVITSHERFEKLYGRRADKVRKLYNGMIPCYYYQFFRKDIKK